MVSTASERPGYFYLENWTSNEVQVGRIVGLLDDSQVRGGIYLGVGPEQNFSYIAAIRPAMAFIVDIRRQALIQHLLYKAIFELSPGRADFVSMLFSRRRPAGIDSLTAIGEVWDSLRIAGPDSAMHASDYRRIRERLTVEHSFAMSDDDVQSLRYVFDTFFSVGPEISAGTVAGSSDSGARRTHPGLGFIALTSQSLNAHHEPRGFLVSHTAYSIVRELQTRNLIVVGDFAGPKAIRTIGRYVADRGGSVSAFYVSNVEQYLYGDRRHNRFYANVAALPTDSNSIFIRPEALQSDIGGRPLCPIIEFLYAVKSGAVSGWIDAATCSLKSKGPG